jgi:hypothetical protein
MSLKTFPNEDCEWTHYCDPCGEAMASVIRDGQKRDPAKRRLPPPPEGTLAPPPPKPAKASKKAAPPAPDPPKAPTAPKAPPEKAPSLKAALKAEGHDLLELMGWKK